MCVAYYGTQPLAADTTAHVQLSTDDNHDIPGMLHILSSSHLQVLVSLNFKSAYYKPVGSTWNGWVLSLMKWTL